MANVLIIICVLLMMDGTQESPSYPKIGGVSRPLAGVDFNFMFQLNNMHGSWKHAWEINLSLLSRKMPKADVLNCNLLSPKLCDSMITLNMEAKESLWNTTQKFASLHTWMTDPSMLATINRGLSRSRRRRSLLPFVGDLEKALFGVATESDVNALKNTIDDILKLDETQNSEIVKLGENLASLTKVTSDQLVTTQQGMKLLQTNMQNLTNQMNFRFRDIFAKIVVSYKRDSDLELGFQIMGILLAHLFEVAAEANSMMIADLSLLENIQVILQGIIPISLVPPEDLQAGLEVAERSVKAEFPMAQLSYNKDSIGYYYTHKIVTPIFQANKITLVVDIPVDLDQQILNLYAVRTFPVPIHYDDDLKKASSEPTPMSELINRHDYFLVSQDGKYYSYAEAGDILLCKGTAIKNCPKQFPLIPMDYLSCLQHLWQDFPFKRLLQLCPYELKHSIHASVSQPTVIVVPLSEGKWYIVSPLNEPWAVTCPSRPPESRLSCSSCVIKVDCGCGVFSKFFTIPTRVAGCQSNFSPLTHNYTLNPFAYLPKSKDWVWNLTGSDLQPNPIQIPSDIKLPSPKNWDDIMESMERKKYDLNRLYSQQQNNTKQFRSASDALVEKIKAQDSILDAIAGWPEWIVGLGLGLSFLNTGLIIMLICCMIQRGGHALPIFERYAGDQPIFSGKEEPLIALDVIILFVCLLNTTILLILSWPILSDWVRSTLTKMRLRRDLMEIKAAGYVRRSRGTNLVLTGSCRFSTSSTHRHINIRVLLGCLPGGWHLSEPLAEKTFCTVTNSPIFYNATIDSPISVVSRTAGVSTIDRFDLSLDHIHEKLSVPKDNLLTSIESVWIHPEAT